MPIPGMRQVLCIGVTAADGYWKIMIEPGTPSPFAPYETLAQALLSQVPNHSDGSHDTAHLLRVWTLVRRLQHIEGGDLEVLLAATRLHDAINVEKSSPARSGASAKSAAFGDEILQGLGWSAQCRQRVAHAIEAHSHSAGVTPATLEACILQDADRLDAIGAIGVARCFYTAGRMQSKLYDPGDPLARARDLNDAKLALDHFKAKLFTLGSNMNTAGARAIARKRQAAMRGFVEELTQEIGA